MKSVIKKTLIISSVISTALVLSGCASWFGIGESEYSCPGRPGGTQCTNSWDLYKMTNNGKVPKAKKVDEDEDEDDEDVNQKEDNDEEQNFEAQGDSDYVIDNFVTPNLPNRPVPVRTPATVMRVWYAPYTDVDGNFVVPGYSYIEIEPRKWTLGVHSQGQGSGVNKTFEPLKATQTSGK